MDQHTGLDNEHKINWKHLSTLKQLVWIIFGDFDK